MTISTYEKIGLCLGLVYLLGAGGYFWRLKHKQDAAHKIPSDCRSQKLDAPEPVRLRCAAHYYARACSGGLPEGCRELANLAGQYPQPEILELARHYKVIP